LSTAISQQNLQVAAGQIGQQPVPKGQQYQLTINTLGRLTDPEQFADIILKAGTDLPLTQTSASASSNAGQAGSECTEFNLDPGPEPETAAGRRRRPAA